MPSPPRLGIITYANDPDSFLVRVVQLSDDDPESELDAPRWVVEGLDTTRAMRMDKVGVTVTAKPPFQKTFKIGNADEFDTFTVTVNATVIIAPGSKSWNPPQSLIDAMARLRLRQGGG
jgi:hypothetical protein